MTDPVVADNIYLKPLTVESIEEILVKHPEIDAVLPTMWTNSIEFVLMLKIKVCGLNMMLIL